jgi:hypothetical protein
MQIELDDFTLRPGSTVVVEIVGHASQFTVPSRVLRCQVSGVAPSIRYRGAIEFKHALSLPDVPSVDSSSSYDANPQHAHARLAMAVRRLDSPIRGEPRILSPWNKIVVRYVDGRMLKGYCQDFHPPRGHFQLWPSPTAPPESQVSVPIGYLKAVYFVRDFAGNPEFKEDTTMEPTAGGRKLAVTFLDDEVLAGTTLNYRPDGIGFHVLRTTSRATTSARLSSRDPSGTSGSSDAHALERERPSSG